MANRFPLIVNTTSGNSVQELPSGDFLDLSNSGISNSGNIAVSGIVSATGNVTGNYILGNGSQLSGIIASVSNISSGTSNVTVVSSGGNVTVGVGGTGNVAVFATTGVYVTGVVSATGNITGGNLSGTNLTGTLATAAQTNITSVGTLSSLSVTGNVQGGNLRTAGLISATGAITGAAITGSSLTVSTGNVSAGNIVNNNANGVGNIGSATTYFNTVFAKATSAQYADLAENYEADADYTPGTVVVFGGLKEITVTNNSHDTAVAGIISTNPSYLMNAGQSGEWILPVALTGRVPCRVQGPVNKGTVLVTGDIPGTAMAIKTSKFEPGCVVGKSLEIINSTDVLTIEVAVGRL